MVPITFDENQLKTATLQEVVTGSGNLRCHHRNKNFSSLAFYDMRDNLLPPQE